MKQNKLLWLDGLRGIMSLNVIVCHFIVVFYPQMYFRDFAEKYSGGLSIFANTPLSIFVNGDIAVRYFLVLTGFLVGRSMLQRERFAKKELIMKSINRYFRLLPVIAVAVVFTYATMKLNLQWHLKISNLVTNSTFYLDYCNFRPTVCNLLLGIFVEPFIKSSKYVGPFWTIRYEFWGYILCMFVCYFLKQYKSRRLLYIGLILFTFIFFSQNFVPLLLGVLVADLYYRNDKNSTFLSPLYSGVIAQKTTISILLVVGLLLASCPMYIKTECWLKSIPTGIIRTLGVSLFLYSTLHIRKLQKVLENRIFLYLGEMSYEIYALHWPIMLVVQTRLFAFFIHNIPYDLAAILSFVLTFPIIIIFSRITYLLISKNKRHYIKSTKNSIDTITNC